MATILFGHTWAEVPEDARAILRQVIEETADMGALAADLGCSRFAALERYLSAKRELQPSATVAASGAEPTGEQLLRAIRRLPADWRRVVFEVLVAQATMAETAVRLNVDPGEVYHRYALALRRLEVELPGLQRLTRL